MIFWGCSKPYSDALPTVQFVSVVPYGVEDSVLITGNVTSSGASQIDYVGFSFSSTPNFDLLSRQVLLNGTTGQFSAIVPAHNDSTFYFKCFAANDYGYVASTVYSYFVPATKPDSAPCSISQNTVIFSGTWTPSYIYAGGLAAYGSYYVEADFGFSYVLDIYFNKVPTNGQYSVLNTTDFIDNTSPYVATIVMDNANSVTEGGYIYIAQNKDGSTTVSFCPLNVDISSVNYPVSAKITFN